MKSMIKYNNRNQFLLLILFLYIYLHETLFSEVYNDEFLNSIIKDEVNANISVIFNMYNLDKNHHYLYYEIIKRVKSKRNFYFINSVGYDLDDNVNHLVENTSIKIVQSNFPDSIFMPLVVSLYVNTIPKVVLFIEGNYLSKDSYKYFSDWLKNAYLFLIENNLDYIFGNYDIINGRKIGSSLLLIKSAIIEHLLYYTNCDTTHMNPFIQLSLANKTNFSFIKFNRIKSIKIKYDGFIFSSNTKCQLKLDTKEPELCIMIPIFKRNYINESLTSLSKQTYKPKFYLFIQNQNRIRFNFKSINQLVKEPIYHIWMSNWNSFFYLNHRLSSVLPCDFIMKYDDDQWPIDNTIHEQLIKRAKNRNIIIGHRGFSIKRTFGKYTHINYKNIKSDSLDHAATPMLIRPNYLKLDARNKIYRMYSTEDIALSLNSWIICRVESKRIKMKLIEKHHDGKNQNADKDIILSYKNEKNSKINLFVNTYLYLILSGYIPKRWKKFRINKKDLINITIDHKSLN